MAITTRHRPDPDRPRSGLAARILSLGCVLLTGCATTGPIHVYTASLGQPAAIRDVGPDQTVDVPSFAADTDHLTGLAYDPYTDHLFLRLAPGNRLRVVDRPDRSIKRELTIPELPATGGGDLTVRPRDGHIFFVCPGESFVIETDRFGKFVRQLELAGTTGAIGGIAFDAERNRLIVAVNGPAASLRIHDLDGRLRQTARLAIGPVTSLAYEATSREVHAVVPGEATTVVLNEDGQMLRRAPADPSVDFLDLGQRSFVRVF